MYIENFVEQVPEVLGEYTSTTDFETLFGGMIVGTSVIIILIISLFCLAIAIGTYVYSAIALKKIAEKKNIKDSWYAWVPILNTVLVLKIAGLNEYFVIAFIVPIFTVMLTAIPYIGMLFSIFNVFCQLALSVFSIYIYMMMSEKCGKDKWLGLLKIVPLGGYILLGILAWGKED